MYNMSCRYDIYFKLIFLSVINLNELITNNFIFHHLLLQLIKGKKIKYVSQEWDEITAIKSFVLHIQLFGKNW